MLNISALRYAPASAVLPYNFMEMLRSLVRYQESVCHRLNTN
ncbi:hypothetical protein HMPREF3226_01729 [Prevotella corporis]|uniref:Uncharacterized protein n=1 Tax=Prevotella corporis TaxID=28128 RepID=A0A133Q4L3_9BACT|nr:hypothetical protein HMPREF3226_01729 [Prevotella corporis]